MNHSQPFSYKRLQCTLSAKAQFMPFPRVFAQVSFQALQKRQTEVQVFTKESLKDIKMFCEYSMPRKYCKVRSPESKTKAASEVAVRHDLWR